MRGLKKIVVDLTEQELKTVPIVWDGMVATHGVGHGRTIPLLIIDTSGRSDIDDMIRAHQHFGAGDVETVWSFPSRFTNNKIQLVVPVKKPNRCTIILEFNVASQGGLIDQIVHSQGVYLQPGRPGDRLISTMDKQKLSVEVPSRDFRQVWDNVYRKALKKRFKENGLSRSKAKKAAQDFIEEWRRISSLTIPDD
jgi:hypothetical protein